MLLSKRKLQFIEEMFTMPYRPVLSHYKSDKLDMSEINNKMSTNHILLSSLNKRNSINNKSLELTKSQKSSFPSYEFNSDINSYINYSIDDLNYTYYNPLKKEIIIENPEEVIQSNYLQGSIKQKPSFSQINDENINDDTIKPLKQPININVYNCLKDNFEENFEKANNLNKPNIVQSLTLNNNNIIIEEENKDNINVSLLIPGKRTETMRLLDNIKPTNSIEESPEIIEQKEAEKEIKEKQIEETPVLKDKKYKITNNNGVIALPPNYSTDDEDEFKAVNSLNEDLSSWKKYLDKDGLKLYFKPFSVKDENGNDVESVIGFLNGILDFPASHVISKLNDFNFRKNFDDQYQKGKLLKEKMEGNIKIMEIYLYMKMPFIFSDRDFVVQKKCWLDYNGNKDHALFHIHSIENTEYPAKEKPVRGNYVNRSAYIKPLGDNQCELTIVTAMDIKMSLGVSTMSKSGAEMQEKWFKNLKKELAK